MIADAPLITIITVVYNAAKQLEQTIQTVLQLTYPNINYIIIDGASVDGTNEVIKKYESKLTYWISERDKGIYDAMNKGWEKAKENSYILFLGAGDYIKTLPSIESINSADVIYGNVFCGDYMFHASVDFRLKLTNSIHHQAELIKKNVHQFPPFSLAFPLYADFDFNQRLYKQNIKFLKDVSFIAYAAPGGVSNALERKEMLEIVKQNFGYSTALLAKAYYHFQKIKEVFTGTKSIKAMITNTNIFSSKKAKAL